MPPKNTKQLLQDILDKLAELLAEVQHIEVCLDHIDAIETEEREVEREHWG